MAEGGDKPTYESAACPVCKENRAANKEGNICQTCKRKIPEYVNMGNAGFESVTVDHWHFAKLGDIAGRTVIKRVLCRECYFKDHKANYPNSYLKADDLSKQISYT